MKFNFSQFLWHLSKEVVTVKNLIVTKNTEYSLNVKFFKELLHSVKRFLEDFQGILKILRIVWKVSQTIPTEEYQRLPKEIWRCHCCSNFSLMWPTFRSSSLWFCGSLPPKWSPGFNSLPVISRGLKSNSCKHETTRLENREVSLTFLHIL